MKLREPTPQRRSRRQHSADYRLKCGVSFDQCLYTGLEPPPADLTDLQSVAPQDAADAELDIEQLALEKLASDEQRSSFLGN